VKNLSPATLIAFLPAVLVSSLPANASAQAIPGSNPTTTAADSARDAAFDSTGAAVDSAAADTAGAGSTTPSDTRWFASERLDILVPALLFTGFVLYYVSSARRGKTLYVRRLAGLDAIDEAIGRATEMGKPVLYLPGLDQMDQPGTVASMNILGQVAEKAAAYDTRVTVPNRDPMVMGVAQDVVRSACARAGRPDLYREEDVYYLTYSQFGYAAGVAGLMLRQRPAANLFLGHFYAESLVMAETGHSIGAIQIAGTDSDPQLPFFITTCDYTLIGEELYAASVYLSRDPLLLGSLKAQDLAKLILLLYVLIGVAAAFAGVNLDLWTAGAG
jgi:hypothetical protein